MKVLNRRADQAIAVAETVQAALHPTESAATFLERSARRRLVCDASGKKQLLVEDPAFSGFVRLERDGRELYLNAGQPTVPTAARLLATGRPLFSLGSPAADGGRPHAHPSRQTAQGDWHTTRDRLDMSAAASRTGALMEAVGEGLRPGQAVAGLHVSDILREAVFLDSGGARLEDQCYGVELTAVVVGEDGSHMVSATRYATALDDIDPVELGRELSVLQTAMGAAGQPFTGTRVVLTPSATAQLLRALVNTILLNPLAHPVPLAASLLDEGPCAAGYGARTFDCEGTPTGSAELVGRDGRQRPVATRKTALADDGPLAAAPLTGHAWWNPLKNFPQPTAGNVRMTPTAGTTARGLLAGERCVVADARTLGVEEFRSGGQLAFRLLAARTVDGVPQEAYAPLSVEGPAIDFLSSVTAVGDDVSYFPGQISAGGAYLEMDLTRITSKAVRS
ncbi:metallopeptidase TldD-related protein [Streptomyces abyssomicinicus]|uniref:metallopeptidase TldD-related protein n=1 Tax=Streptomyces abyssomicinicus TaxID=574929 RepID=UPI00124FBEC6|nr:metallopeptidase TldD-related protein [Streptomyces abyssomicinicus]